MVAALMHLILSPGWADWSEPRLAPGGRGLTSLRDGRLIVPGWQDGQGGSRLVCFSSSDQGATWEKLGDIAQDADPKTDLGDGNFAELGKGRLIAVYRRNHAYRTPPAYRIESVESSDGGKTWGSPTLVAESSPQDRNPSRGLWPPFVFVTDRGVVQCYYDDESTPYAKGFRGHQWVTMKTWSKDSQAWVQPVTVARAKDLGVLSRDGMPSVIQADRGRLICAFESVQATSPHAGCLRVVTSDDNGLTWSWAASDRPILYQAKDRRYHAFSPALVRVSRNVLALAFATNEDRPEPGISGTPAKELNLDIKLILSRDGGRIWPQRAELIHTGKGQNYLPGLTVLRHPGKHPVLISTFLDFHEGFKSRMKSLDGRRPL